MDDDHSPVSGHSRLFMALGGVPGLMRISASADASHALALSLTGAAPEDIESGRAQEETERILRGLGGDVVGEAGMKVREKLLAGGATNEVLEAAAEALLGAGAAAKITEYDFGDGARDCLDYAMSMDFPRNSIVPQSAVLMTKPWDAAAAAGLPIASGRLLDWSLALGDTVGVITSEEFNQFLGSFEEAPQLMEHQGAWLNRALAAFHAPAPPEPPAHTLKVGNFDHDVMKSVHPIIARLLDRDGGAGKAELARVLSHMEVPAGFIGGPVDFLEERAAMADPGDVERALAAGGVAAVRSLRGLINKRVTEPGPAPPTEAPTPTSWLPHDNTTRDPQAVHLSTTQIYQLLKEDTTKAGFWPMAAFEARYSLTERYDLVAEVLDTHRTRPNTIPREMKPVMQHHADSQEVWHCT